MPNLQPFDFLILILIIASSIALLMILRPSVLWYFGIREIVERQDQQMKLTRENNHMLRDLLDKKDHL